MSMKSKPIIPIKSSEKVSDFLEKNCLHKKDFAQMIGVTLSYVYNLIDNTIPFSTRGTTLERIATVMGIMPEEFEEYKIPQEPIVIDKTITFIKDKMKDGNMSVVKYLKNFDRKKRLYIVDVLRGAEPLPIDYNQLYKMCSVLNISKKDIYALWQNRMLQFLESGGFNINANTKLLEKMFTCAKEYIASN